ncbi:MAG: hypothetical protein F6J93_06785 [Oscillatoria sp. SIO1A7]|nr:hypothetical protein [Oscillatoria sp. SIO1A7]
MGIGHWAITGVWGRLRCGVWGKEINTTPTPYTLNKGIGLKKFGVGFKGVKV